MNIKKYLNEFPWWGQLIILICALGLLVGVFCFNAWLLKVLWNAIIPSIFALNTITFKQSFGLMLIVWILRSFPVKFSTESKK